MHTGSKGNTGNSNEEKSMKDLNYALKQLCQRNRDGSFATQAGVAAPLNPFRRRSLSSMRA